MDMFVKPRGTTVHQSGVWRIWKPKYFKPKVEYLFTSKFLRNVAERGQIQRVTIM